MPNSYAIYKPTVWTMLLRQTWLFYGLVALAVLAPLLTPGYILTLDMVFTPHLRLPAASTNDYLFRALLHGLNMVLPADVIEKLVLLTIMVLAGTGMHWLARSLYRAGRPRYQAYGAYFAGVLYVLNPFTYDRFMAGQYEVLLGYALLPWFALLLFKFLAKPGAGRAIWLAGCAAVMGIVSIHSLGLATLLAVTAFVLAAWQRRTDRGWLARAFGFGALATGLWLLASSYWLVPLAMGHGSVAAQLQGITAADQSAFASAGGNPLGRLANIVRLQGFWAEARGLFVLPQARVPAWGMIGLMVWALVATGAVQWWRAGQRIVALVFAISAMLAAVVACGALSGWPTAHLPFLSGYREPQKFVALLALAYAVLAGRGTMAALAYCQDQGGQWARSAGAVLLTAIPLVWTSSMLGGFGGQLRPVQYPAEWTVANSRLDADSGNYQTLFLPWHLYAPFRFAGRTIASPAPAFFDKPVIVSDNPEYRGAALANSTAAKRVLDQLLPQAAQAGNLSNQLAALRIKYILVSHDGGYQQYNYLVRSPHIRLVSQGNALDVYRNESYQE